MTIFLCHGKIESKKQRRREKMPKLKRESAREQIRDSILKAIHKGDFPLGYRLREKELADMYGTSQAPVREALRELEGLQYVETIPYKGTVVKEVTAEDLSMAYRLRGTLEEMALERIAQKQLAFDMDELKAIAKEVEEAAKKKDKEAYAEHNIRFHAYFIDCAETAMLKRMWKLVAFPVQVENALAYERIDLMTFSQEHYQIIEALERKDMAAAGRLLFEHANKVSRQLLD